jgi:hypothetical protein
VITDQHLLHWDLIWSSDSTGFSFIYS